MDEEKKPKNEELIIEAKNFFDFHKKELGESIRKGNNIIYIDFMKLIEFSNKLSDEILSNPEEALRLVELAIEESGLVSNARVRLYGLPKTQEIKVRNIRSKHLNELIVIEGIIRQASDVRPQVVNAKFECPSCGTVISVLQIEKKFREPSRCSCGRRGGFKLISKEMVDTQRIVIEESPESLSGGEQPKRINIFVKEDLVEPRMEEKTTPGSRIKVIGVLKEVPVPLHSGGLSTRFELAVEANNLIPLEETFEDLDINEEDEKQILELSEDPKIFEKLARSITPSIWGYEEIKKALVLQLFGGVPKVLSDGQKSRGDIHILLIGDPGVAKSIGKDERVMFSSDKEAGYDTLENIYKKFGKNPKDLNVLTIDQKSQESRWEKVSEIIKHLPEKNLIKVGTEHGKSIIATKDHSFITLSKEGGIIPIKGEELTKNTFLPIPINYHKELFKFFTTEYFNKKNTSSKLLPKKILLDKDFGFFIGIFLSEGYIKNEKTIEISNKNREIQDKVMQFAKKIGLNYNVNKKSVSIFSKNLSNILKAYCYSEKDLNELTKGTKGNYSRIKKIPEFLHFAPREFIYNMISGLFLGDGRLIKDTKMLKGFELITISRQLAEGTSDLLLSIGIVNKIKKREYTYNQKKTDYYSVAIPTYMIKDFVKNIEFIGRDIKLNEKDPVYSYNNLIPCGDLVYQIVKKLKYNSRKTGDRTLAAEMRTVKKRGTIGRLRLLKLIKNFEGKSKEKMENLETLKKIANSNILWSKINDIKLLKKRDEEVYDLSIPSTNTFVSNGIGVHNSVTLTFIANISPKGRYVVGKSASGAGITATVVRDEYLRGWSLEAGAMVLANKGLVCIDELEKMDPQDRSAMHEAMEQQCYHQDTIITLADGSETKIRDLVEGLLEENKEKIIKGKDCLILPTKDLEVLTTDFNKIYKTKVDRISKHKAFDKFIKIKFSHGREITVTPEHPIFIAKEGKIKTERADKIKIGSSIPIPLKIPIVGKEQHFTPKNEIVINQRIKQNPTIPTKNCEELFKIVGYLVSEGSREKNRGKIVGFNFTNKNEEVLNDFESLMKKVFNLLPYKQMKIDSHAPRFSYRYISNQLAQFAKEFMPEILNLSGEKSLPSFIMKGEKENISKTLSALFEGDGYVSIKERTVRVGYKTKSKRLAEQIQDLLLRFRIRSSITENSGFYRVGITSYNNLQNFAEEIGFVTQEKNYILRKYLSEKTIRRHVKNKLPLEFNKKIIEIIKDERIKQVGKYKVYDIIYDHSKRKDVFAFSTEFLQKLLELLKKQKNKDYIQNLIGDIGWEKVSGIEIIENESEDWVYDITVEPSHAFVSQASILHNTVTISKANVQATLKAETSVLAAANPKFGRFDPYQSIAQQIDLPPTLINRFDVIFTLRDIPNREKDEQIASHVLHEHREQGESMLIPREIFRKYVAYSKQKIKPELSNEAVDEIKKFYVDLRNRPVASESAMRPIPISARQLQALIRMSEASAKLRLSKKVTIEDARRAVDLMKYYLMQVGYDYESKTIDIDKITLGRTASQRNKVFIVRDTITELEGRMGKLIPIEEIEKELENKLNREEIGDAITELEKHSLIFRPRRGYVQRM